MATPQIRVVNRSLCACMVAGNRYRRRSSSDFEVVYEHLDVDEETLEREAALLAEEVKDYDPDIILLESDEYDEVFRDAIQSAKRSDTEVYDLELDEPPASTSSLYQNYGGLIDRGYDMLKKWRSKPSSSSKQGTYTGVIDKATDLLTPNWIDHGSEYVEKIIGSKSSRSGSRSSSFVDQIADKAYEAVKEGNKRVEDPLEQRFARLKQSDARVMVVAGADHQIRLQNALRSVRMPYTVSDLE